MRQLNPWFTTNMAFGKGFSLTKVQPITKVEAEFFFIDFFFSLQRMAKPKLGY